MWNMFDDDIKILLAVVVGPFLTKSSLCFVFQMFSKWPASWLLCGSSVNFFNIQSFFLLFYFISRRWSAVASSFCFRSTASNLRGVKRRLTTWIRRHIFLTHKASFWLTTVWQQVITLPPEWVCVWVCVCLHSHVLHTLWLNCPEMTSPLIWPQQLWITVCLAKSIIIILWVVSIFFSFFLLYVCVWVCVAAHTCVRWQSQNPSLLPIKLPVLVV